MEHAWRLPTSRLADELGVPSKVDADSGVLKAPEALSRTYLASPATMNRLGAFRRTTAILFTPPSRISSTASNVPSLWRSYASKPTPGVERAPLTEKEFQHAIKYPVKHHSFEPGKWLSVLEVTELEVALPAELVANPLNALESPSTPVATVQNALILYVKRLHSQTKGAQRQKARETFIQDRVGNRALLWLLQEEKVTFLSYGEALRTAKVVTHCLIAENAGNSLRAWIHAAQPRRPGESEREHYTRVRIFGGLKIRGMVEALAYWTTRADPFEDVLPGFNELLTAHRRPAQLSVTEAANYIKRNLPGVPNTDPRVYDTFVQNIGIWIRDATQCRYEAAKLKLYHPTMKTGGPMLDFLRMYASNEAISSHPFVAALCIPFFDAPQTPMFCEGVKAAQLLEHHGQHDDARWILELMKERFPRALVPGRNVGPRTGKSNAMPRTISENERRLGVERYKTAAVSSFSARMASDTWTQPKGT